MGREVGDENCIKKSYSILFLRRLGCLVKRLGCLKRLGYLVFEKVGLSCF